MVVMKEKKIVFLMGVSGCGKLTLMKMLLKLPDFVQDLSYVTRPMREWDIDGEEYRFISEEEFKAGIEKWEFLEYAWVHNNGYYGTKKTILNLLETWKIPIKETEINGLKYIINSHQIPGRFFSIFMDISDEIIVKRITWRAPVTQEEIAQRLKDAAMEREEAKKYCDVIITVEWTPEENFQKVVDVLKKNNVI